MEKKSKFRFGMFLVTIGIVYGDIGTSPMYVMKSILEDNGGIQQINESFIIGSLSLVIWTITLLTTVKYVLIAMKADNHGEGGIFSLFSLVRNTGAEALYSDMGHVGRENIYFSWPFVKICLILNYLGQGAWIIQNQANTALYAVEDLNPFFLMLPTFLRPFAVVLGALAAIIASQALITGSYTLVSEAILLDLLPHLEIRYPSDTKGQLYISTVNRILWLGCSLVVLYFRSGARMESAYGLAITVTMLMTTLLISVYLRRLRGQGLLSWVVLLVFGVIEFVFFLSSLGKFLHGGYVTVILTLLLLLLMIIWHRGTQLEQKYSTRLDIHDFLDNLEDIHADREIPLLTSNLVFLDNSSDFESIDRDIMYSIFDKDPKRAEAYWFVHVSVLDEPDTMYYKVETYGTNYIFRVKLYLGFRCSPRINVYLRQIVHDLQATGEMPQQDKKYSIYGRSTVGAFKFCIIHKSVSSKTELSPADERILHMKYAIRHIAGSKENWFGLDTSTLITEHVPLILMSAGSHEKIERARRH